MHLNSTNQSMFHPQQPTGNSKRPNRDPWIQFVRCHVHYNFRTCDTKQPVENQSNGKLFINQAKWTISIAKPESKSELKIQVKRKFPRTVTASFNNDSPKTTIYSISLTCISSKTARTATGSTAAINDENRKISSRGICLPNKFIKLHAYKEEPKTL